jgi:predicted DNA-binding transcriptional regulator AlpA
MTQPISTRSPVAFDDLPDSAFIRLHQLLSASIIPFSAATAWRRVRARTFPQPIRISPQVTAWRVGDVRKWIKDPANYVTDTTSNCR